MLLISAGGGIRDGSGRAWQGNLHPAVDSTLLAEEGMAQIWPPEQKRDS